MDKQHDEHDQALNDKYIDTFNSRYILDKHEPELFKQIEPSLEKDSPLLHGKQQFEIEKAQDYLKKVDRGDDKGKEKLKDKDADVKR